MACCGVSFRAKQGKQFQEKRSGEMSKMTGEVMVAFHGKTEVKDKYLQRVRAHRLADELVRGQYWDKDRDGVFRGCAVGCTLHSSNHGDYETELGIPHILAYMEDRIFEGLPEDRAMSWPEEFLAAPQVGADLSLVWPQLAVWMLIDLEHGIIRFVKSEGLREVIQAIAHAYSTIASGGEVSATKWREIYKNALDLARDLDLALDLDLARAAARHKVRVAQADKLLELMAAAPVVQSVATAVGV
jgi:hypothetical protein